MKLKIKDKFKNCKVEGKFNIDNISNIPEDKYEFYYNNGLSNFFEVVVVEENKRKKRKGKKQVKFKGSEDIMKEDEN